MIFPSDLHTHTFYSDGKSDAVEYIKTAIDRGFTSLGFSEHSFTDFDSSFCMSREKRAEYIEKLPALKEKYRGALEIYIGTEFDVFSNASEEPFSSYDYVLGACHYVDTKEGNLPVDKSCETSREIVEKYFGGDYIAYCERYFENLSRLADVSEVDIVAHFDLVTKFNEGGKCFDENDERYKKAALAAMEKLVSAGKIFEINTGAISRGYRTEPYPSRFLLSELRQMNGKITFSSDSHTASNIGFGFEEAARLAVSCGFDKAYLLCGGEFVLVDIR